MKRNLIQSVMIIFMIMPGFASTQGLNHNDGYNSPISVENLTEFTEENFVANPPFMHLEGKIPQHRIEHYRSLVSLSDKEETLLSQQQKSSQEKVNLDSLYYFVNEEVREKTYYQFDAQGNLIRTEIYMLNVYQNEPFDIPIVIIDYSYNSQGQRTLQRTRSIIYENLPEVEYIVDFETEFDYDHAGRQTFYSSKNYDYNAGELVNGWRWFREHEDMYDTSIYYLSQKGSGQEWINHQLLEITLFADGTTDILYYKTANSQGVWASGTKNDFISWYNAEQYEDVYMYSYVADNDDWIPFQRNYILYNDHGNSAFFYEYHYHEESWWEKFRNTYHYDENLLQTYTLQETRSTPESEFENYRMWTFEHDALGNRIAEIEQNWDADEMTWVNNQKILHEFEHIAGYTLRLIMVWEPSGEVWENQNRVIRDFDDAGNSTYYKQQYWTPQFQHWYAQLEIIREFNSMNQLFFEQRKQNQNAETLLWEGWGVKLQTEFDSYGYFHVREQHSWNSSEQEFEWESTRVYTHDFYGNIKKQQNLLSGHQETTLIELGYATYPVTLEIHSQGEPLEGAVLTMMGTNFPSDAQGLIAFNATLDHEMTVDYMIEKEGYNTRQGQMKIDRIIDMAFNMVAEGTTTYNVSFLVKKGDILIEDAAVYLTGYGMQPTCDEGMTTFEEVIPENNISYTVTYGGMTFTGIITVTDHNMTVEVDLDEITSVVLEELPQVHIYPNPVSHNLHVSLKSLPVSTVSIFDMSGRKVFEQEFTEGDHTLDAEFLNNGAYVVVIGHGNFRQVIKLLKR